MKPQDLAKLTVEKYIKEDKLPEPPNFLEGVEVKKAGAFVSIKTKEGNLRGCIGTIFPTEDKIHDEIINNAVSAATRDPRFPQIEEHELENIVYSVDLLHEPVQVRTFEELNPKEYGIIVNAKNGKQALLLPDLDGLDTVEKQVSACMRKAGITPGEPVYIQKFKVDRFSETES